MKATKDMHILADSVFDQKTATKYEQSMDGESKLREYQIVRTLGQGAYAIVKLAQHKVTK